LPDPTKIETVDRQRSKAMGSFMPNESAGGFPAMVGNVPFLMKDVVILAASLYLLKQDVVRLSHSTSRA
jgi:hypothetical protein